MIKNKKNKKWLTKSFFVFLSNVGLWLWFREEIEYIMMCVDANQDGKVDFNEFTDRFHNPAKDIGFTMAVLLTNLSEHMPSDPRYEPVVGPLSGISIFSVFKGIWDSFHIHLLIYNVPVRNSLSTDWLSRNSFKWFDCPYLNVLSLFRCKFTKNNWKKTDYGMQEDYSAQT